MTSDDPREFKVKCINLKIYFHHSPLSLRSDNEAEKLFIYLCIRIHTYICVHIFERYQQVPVKHAIKYKDYLGSSFGWKSRSRTWKQKTQWRLFLNLTRKYQRTVSRIINNIYRNDRGRRSCRNYDLYICTYISI